MNRYISFCKLLVASILAAGLASGFVVNATAQTSSASPSAGGDMKPPPLRDGKTEQGLSAAQIAKIKSVLASYKAATLTAADAKVIKRTLRDAGIRPSRALGDTMMAAGFDPRRLDELDPPPARPPAGDAPK